MKVKDLIEKLQKFDPELEVSVFNTAERSDEFVFDATEVDGIKFSLESLDIYQRNMPYIKSIANVDIYKQNGIVDINKKILRLW